MIPWTFEGIEVITPPDTALAFVYLLEFQCGAKYIGKKNLVSVRRKKVEGKTRKQVIKSESDWRKYLSSSLEVKSKIKTGDKLVKREIIRWCDTVGQASYWEAYYQFFHHVLLDTTWLNKWISIKVYKQKLKEDNE